MSRKTVDCRTIPNDIGCTLTISGEESELMRAAVDHAVNVHGDKDTPELRQGIQEAMTDELSMNRYAEDTSERSMRV